MKFCGCWHKAGAIFHFSLRNAWIYFALLRLIFVDRSLD